MWLKLGEGGALQNFGFPKIVASIGMKMNSKRSPGLPFPVLPRMIRGKTGKGRCLFWSVTQDGASLVLGYYRAVPPGTPDGSHSTEDGGRGAGAGRGRENGEGRGDFTEGREAKQGRKETGTCFRVTCKRDEPRRWRSGRIWWS